ncbi:MAG: SIS domain-containing protein, partial [Caulobacteraceae bacterium]
FMVGGSAGPGVISLASPEADPAVQPIGQALAFYRFAERLARARGLDPDRPPHLAKVTETL